MAREAPRLLAPLVLCLAAACPGPQVPHPAVGQSRYLCCNLHYEKTKITDANYQKGTLVPFGTRVQLLDVRGNTVKFQPEGHPPLTLAYRWGKKGNLGLDQYLDRVFVTEDPRAKLASPKKSGKRKEPDASGPTRKLIEQGTVEPGMTKEQVLMALGYPPAHRTPSLDAPMWTYWENRVVTFEVHFDGDKVARVNR